MLVSVLRGVEVVQFLCPDGTSTKVVQDGDLTDSGTEGDSGTDRAVKQLCKRLEQLCSRKGCRLRDCKHK